MIRGNLTGAPSGGSGDIFEEVAGSVPIKSRLPSPAVSTASFDPSGAQLNIAFTSDVYPNAWVSSIGTPTSSGPCATLFQEAVPRQLSASANLNRARTAWCTFTSPRLLTMLLGPGATMSPSVPYVAGSSCAFFGGTK